MAHLLGTQSLHLALPDRVLLDEVTLGIDEGDRIGVVGRNGDGKSTLLRLLSRERTPDSGRVTVRGGVRVGVLDQQDSAPEGVSVRDRVVGGGPEHEWASDARIRDVLAGLLGGIDLDQPLTALSGGQLRRVHLAELLVGDWDVLLLDEPTNHLDVEGIAWLAEHLRRRWSPRDGGLVVITHDRWFLDAVCTRMWEVHDGVVDPFEGGYAAYVLQRVERDRQAAAIEARRQNLMRKELAWLRRGAPARTSKPKFRIDAANELIAGEPPVRDTVELTQLATSRLGRDVIDVLDVDAGYDGRAVLEDVTLHIGPADRIGILGPNGAGKSTLLGLVTGSVTPMSGRVKKGRTVTVRQVSQRLEGLAGLEEELALTDRALLIQLVPDVEAESALLERWAAERRVDGVALLDARVEDPRVAVIERTGLPAAAMASAELSPCISRLAVDEDERMDLVLERVLARLEEAGGAGHRHLLYLGGLPQFQHVQARERRFRERCADAGVGASVLHSDYQERDVERWTAEVLTLHREAGLRAVVVDNDLLAAQLLVALRTAGVAVPEALSIVALEDSVLCTVTSPSLTALHRDTREAGRRLARLLVRHTERGRGAEDIGAGRLVVRQSG